MSFRLATAPATRNTGTRSECGADCSLSRATAAGGKDQDRVLVPLTEEIVEQAAKLLERYYLDPDEKTGRLSTGSHFDE